jgi:hypothetical protein
MKKQLPGKSKTPANLLPEPMELAKLAALLAPTSGPLEALKKAAQLYTEAVFFMRGIPSFEALDRNFGNQERRRRELMPEPPIENHFLKALLLDPAVFPNDAAGALLSKHGLPLKTAKSVLAHLHRFLKSQHEEAAKRELRYPNDPKKLPEFRLELARQARSIIEGLQIKRKDGQLIGYEIPARWLLSVARGAKQRRSESRRKGWRTRKENPVK